MLFVILVKLVESNSYQLIDALEKEIGRKGFVEISFQQMEYVSFHVKTKKYVDIERICESAFKRNLRKMDGYWEVDMNDDEITELELSNIAMAYVSPAKEDTRISENRETTWRFF